jgi:Asp-tRNA(Asn)/Glu-tRNA(Gln) amidotransferase A subunit family amidase
VELTIQGAAADIQRGKLSCRELLEKCLANIDRYETQVKAWVFVDRDGARQEADRRDAELKGGQRRGPLHGIPIGVKDIFDVFDWPTAAGSKRWSQSVARRDATVVERLRRAGAVFVGKTVTTQYASFDPPPTRNPWHKDRTPGGSSSGSAAGLACGMMLGALGSQTGGSITRPASYCGVAGCKPTFGRVSCAGVMPLAPSLDHPGPMARCVTDLALMLQVLAGHDPLDPVCQERSVPDYLAGIRRGFAAGAGPRLGWVRGFFDDRAEPQVRTMMAWASSLFQERGATLTEIGLPASFAEVIPRHRTVMAVEGAAYHASRLQRHPEDYLPKISSLLEEGLACPAPEYARCKDHQALLTREMRACFQDVDALLAPATTSPAPAADTTGDPAFQAPWSYTGLPTVSFPARWNPEGLPLCIQLVGRPWTEDQLFAAAAWCESVVALEKRVPPPGPEQRG